MCQPNRAPKLLPIGVVMGMLLWIFTMTGGRQIFVNEMLSEAYDSQAEHLFRGDPGVDGGAIRHESLIVDGKTRMYLRAISCVRPHPAKPHLPERARVLVAHLWVLRRNDCASRVRGIDPNRLTLVATVESLEELARKRLSGRIRLWLPVAPASRQFINLRRSNRLGIGWVFAALYFALRSRTAEGVVLTLCLLASFLAAGAALLSRATFGAPLLLVAPILALRFFKRNPIRNFAALFLPLGAAFLFHLFLTYAKFGDFSGMPLRYSINPVQRDFALKHGIFRLERVPYSFADYFILRYPEFQREPPYLKGQRQSYNHPTLYVMPFTETYSSLLWCSSWLVLGAVIGVAMFLRPSRFRLGGSRNCRGLFVSECRCFVVHGPLSTLRCGVLSIPYLRFPLLSAEWPGRISSAICAYCVSCRLGGHKLNYNRVLAS